MNLPRVKDDFKPLFNEEDGSPIPPNNDNGHTEIITDVEPEIIPDEPEDTGGRRESVPSMLTPVAPSGAGFLEDYNPLDELFSEGKGDNGLDLRTELNEIQIIQFARARAIAAYYKIPQLAVFVKNIERLSVSKGRKGRREFVEAFRAASVSDAEAGMAAMGGVMGKLKS